MFTRQRFMLAAAIAAAVVVSACHREQGDGERRSADAGAVSHAQAVLAQPAWLRKHLPANTVSYVRLPSLWQVAGALPNGRPLDVAVVDDAHLQIVGQLRAAIGKDPVLAQANLTPYLMILLDELRSPIEVALVDPSGITSPAAHGLITAQVAYDNVAQLQTRLESLKTPLLMPSTPFDAQGTAALGHGGWIHFADHRLFIYQGMQPVDRAGFDALLADVAKPGDHPVPPSMAALEPRIDTSGEGLFGWVSIRGVGGLAAAQLPTAEIGTLPGDLAAKADAIAFGAGTVDGRGRFRVILHAPQSRLLGYLAPREFSAGLKTAGKPRWAMSVALPGSEQVAAFENNVNLDFGQERGKAYRAWAARVKTENGVDLAGWAGLLGPELVVFADDAGTFVALRVRDHKAFADTLTRLAASKHWRLDLGDAGKASVHGLTISMLGGMPKSADNTTPPALMALLQRMGTHVYWTEEGDFLVFSKVPQALADRAAAKLDTDLGDWLKAQSFDGKTTLAGLTATTRDAHRDAYYTYIGMLDVLGDFAGTAIDVRKLPSASALDLPRSGVLGTALEADGESIGFSITYEQNPAEFITSGGGGGTVAVAYVAIMAAIAIPAYQDYTHRSQVSEGLGTAEAAKQAVGSYRLAKGRFPASLSAVGVTAQPGRYTDPVTLNQGGELIIRFSPTAKTFAGGTLILSPLVDGDQVTWTCTADSIPAKWLPATCRDAASEP